MLSSQLLNSSAAFYAGLLACILTVAFAVRRQRWAPNGLRRVPGPAGVPLGMSLMPSRFILWKLLSASRSQEWTVSQRPEELSLTHRSPAGNTFQLGPQPQRQLKAWADQYGELMQVQIGWENWIFLNTPEAVKEILDKQSAVTSGRPPMPVGNDLISGGMRFLLMDYTSTWRKLRTIVHKLLTPKMSNTFMPSQLFESKQLVFDLLTDNKNLEDFYMHVRRYTTSVVLTSTYGRRVQSWVRRRL